MTVTTRLEITSTSEGRNVSNSVISTTTTEERNVPEVIRKVCLAGGRAHRRKLSEIFLIDEARSGQVPESDSGPTRCKQSLMEGSDPGTHMHGCTQSHTYKHLNARAHTHTRQYTRKGGQTHSLLTVYIPCCLP